MLCTKRTGLSCAGNWYAPTFVVLIYKIKISTMTVLLIVLNLLLNSTQVIVTDQGGKNNINNSTEFVILDECNI